METRTKERLTGALILVAAMVILVPELLSGHRDRGVPADVPAARPATEGAPLRTYTMDLRTPVDAAVKDQTALNVRPAEGEGASAPAPVPAPESAPVVVLPAAAGVAAASAEPPKPQPNPQVLLKPDDPKPQADAAPVAPQAASPAPPPKHKADAGPGKAAAQSVKAQAAASAAATAEGNGWYVQLGSFSKRENAQHLVQQLAAKGHTAQMAGGAGSSLIRVRVGPLSDRPAAVALQSRLAAQGFKGSVTAP